MARTRQDLSFYYKLTSKQNVIPREAQTALLIKWRETGDVRYRNQVINSNLRLVVQAALRNRFYPHVDLEDLIQAGNLALLVAAEKFDTSRGVAFSTYAQWWVRAQQNELINRSYLLQLHSSQTRQALACKRGEILDIERDWDLERADLRRRALAARVGTTVDDVRTVGYILGGTHSDSAALSAEAPPDHEARDLDEKRRTALSAATRRLSPRAREVLRMKIFDGATHEQIGRHFDRSREWSRSTMEKNRTDLRRHTRNIAGSDELGAC